MRAAAPMGDDSPGDGKTHHGPPQRIQRKRSRGWRMPPNTVYVGRPSMWGNHVAAACCIKERAQAVAVFRRWVDEVASGAWRGRAAIDLRGKNLACWCPLDQPCHADVLLELANRGTPTQGAPPGDKLP